MMASQTSTEVQRYLTFKLAEEAFAIPLLQVKEVIAMPDVTPVPQTPAHFLGIMNLRGQVITVLDLRLKMGLKAAQKEETAVVICDLDGMCVGVVVDSVESVLAADATKLSPKPELTGAKAEAVVGVYQKEGSLTLLLNLSKALSISDQALLRKAAA